MSPEQIKKIRDQLISAKKAICCIEKILESETQKELIEMGNGKLIVDIWKCIFRPEEYSDYESILNEFKGHVQMMIWNANTEWLNRFSGGVSRYDMDMIFYKLELNISNWDKKDLQVIRKRLDRLSKRIKP